MNRRPIALCLVALTFAAACDLVQEPDPLPSTVEARAAFLTAWSGGDYEQMSDRLDEGSPWTAERLARVHRRLFAAGAVTQMQVAADGGVDQPQPDDIEEGGGPISVQAGYSIAYTSDASRDPLELTGQLELTLPTAEADEWRVLWDRDDLFPQLEDAHTFAVEHKWLKRGAILDRSGRKLAVGRAQARRYPQGTLAGTTVGHIEPYEEEKPGRSNAAAKEEEDEEEAEDEDRDEPDEGADPTSEATASPDATEPEATASAPDLLGTSDDDADADADTDAGAEGSEVEPEPGDLVGASGLELALQDRLAGTPTSELTVVGRRGEVVEVVGRRRGRPGRNVKTTLDVRVQRAAENAYGATTGGAVVMDPDTGDLLAVVSSSAFSPANYVGVAGIEPFNRALSGLYPPGSSLKVMTGAAALEEGVVKESTKLSGPAEYKGVRNFESGAFGTLDFATAVRHSVNTAFAQIAEDLGARKLKRYADSFGFNRPPEMPLGAATSSFPFPQDEGDVMWSSIGQAQVLATPLQMTTIAATIANGGKRMEPRILLRAARSGERVVSRKVATTMTRLMENVVKSGTGTGAAISAAQVAGKTGTAEVDVNGKRMNHAWFISFAPSQSPKVAVAVVSELGGVGGQVAAPLAGRILSSVLPLVK